MKTKVIFLNTNSLCENRIFHAAEIVKNFKIIFKRFDKE